MKAAPPYITARPPFAEDAQSVTTDDSGNASITFEQLGKWYIWSLGYNDGSVVCSPAYMEVNVTWKNTSDVTSHWHNFRNSYVNMALSDAKTPVNSETTTMKWAVKLGTGWNANPSVQIIADDALVVMIGKVLYKLDLQTGEVLQQADMTAAPNFGYTPCTEPGYTGDKICNVCRSTEKGEVVEAPGHAYTEGTCTVCGEADPDYKTAEGEAEIYVTLAGKGNVVMFQQKITVLDVNHNGIFDVDDTLYAAHEAGYEGGASAGYSTAMTQYGLSISKLWGDTSMCYGYWLNNASCWSLEDVVANGNHLVAFVYTDGEFWSDAYSKFDTFDYNITTAQDLVVKLEKAGYDENWNSVFSAHAGATITVYDSDGKALTTGYTVTDNGDGSYAIRITAAGSYYVVATDSDPLTVPAVCQVVVTFAGQNPNTGDHGMVLLAVAIMSTSLLAVLCISKKRAF